VAEARQRKISVAIDASLWDEPTTGIGLYTRNLVAAMEREGVPVRRIGARHSGEHPRGAMGRTAYFLAQLSSVLDSVDEPIFHAVCNFNLPPVRIPGKRLVLTVHDLIPDLLPDTVSFAFRWQFRLWLARSLRIADRVICVSHRTRDDLAARFDVDRDKLTVIHLGVDHVDGIAEPDAAGAAFIQALALPRQYVLHAGALDVRKNIDLLLNACAVLHARGKAVPLLLVGQEWYGSEALAKRIAHLRSSGLDIRALGYQSEPIFYALMRRATVFAFPSRYEGFGLPPLEAMRLGVPTVVSSAGALPEVCGEAAMQIDPGDAEGLASAIELLMGSESERRARVAAGREWAGRFRWQTAAKETIGLYRSVLDHAP